MESGPGRPRDPAIDAAIVEATRALLREGGLAAVTIAAVAARAGVTRPTVYRRFADREALALGVLHADLERVGMAGLGDVSTDLPLADQVLKLWTPILTYYAEDPALTRALLQLVLFAPDGERQALDAQLFAFLTHVATRVAGAMARGELRPDTDVPALTSSLFALYLVLALTGAQGALDLPTQLDIFGRGVRQQLRGVLASAPEAP